MLDTEARFLFLFAGFCLVMLAVDAVRDWRWRRQQLKVLCRHGVRGGNAIPPRCAECRAAFESAQALADAQRTQRARDAREREQAARIAAEEESVQRSREARERRELARIAAEEEKALLARNELKWQNELLRRSRTVEDLRAMHHRDFELLMWLVYRRLGFVVTETSKGSDGGFDGLLMKDGELFVLQCKRYRDTVVAARVVRELYGVMRDLSAQRGILVTTGRISGPAREFCEGKQISLVDCDLLPSIVDSAILSEIPVSTPHEPTKGICPQCGNALRVVRSRSGKQSFIGCTGYPACRYTENARG